VEVTNVSGHGLWLFVHDRELFLSFHDFPWFKDATVGEIANVQLPSSNHLYWPDLDIDLAVDSIDHPERYPLVSQVWPDKKPQSVGRMSPRRRLGRGR
jgi:hypothetical protein